ncbi:hypothetical protein SUGI_1043040 [Cryptomeria japonica]|uniref:auxin-responsive protein IAA30 n=1 Tax=Cryptomeria japonica TaxID=3369 RepID=UPI002414C0C9|nr:auxin-responsive protein IAA30 [Cryptomeria japonica]GLJ49334.1 hypothetical protein SUGI_1043040 [Cryptomeria japonica]
MAASIQHSRCTYEEENLELMETELRLGLPGIAGGQKRRSSHDEVVEASPSASLQTTVLADPATAPPPKAQIVGWPPVRSFRKISLAPVASKLAGEKATSSPFYVKVSMDGAPYLRKVDLKMYSSYHELSCALEKMFSCFTMGQCGSHYQQHGLSESKLTDLLNGSEYVPTYEDKDGDLMLVGDVPWEMFVDSCKRMRIMKASEAIGLGKGHGNC